MRIVRWILLPIVCLAAWIAALFTGMVTHSVAESLCPANQMVSAVCVAPWFASLEAWLMRFFSAFAAALIIVSCYFTAPTARAVVAWAVLAVGGVYALWIAIVSWAWGEFIAAGVGGVAAVLVLTSRQRIFTRINRVAQQQA